jgi:hypothetical protein
MNRWVKKQSMNNAVYLMEDFLNTTGTPGHGVPYDGEVKYGPRAEQIAESIHVAAMFACFNRIPTLFDYHRKIC